MSTTTGQFTENRLKSLSATLDDPDWMLDRRLDALKAFKNTPMPTLKDEEWRYTDISGLDLDQVRHRTPDSEREPIPTDRLEDFTSTNKDSSIVVQEGTEIIEESLKSEIADKDVVVTPLREAVREHEDVAKEHFMTTAVPPEAGKFQALHGAFWNSGIFVYIPPNVTVDLPINVLIWGGATGGIFNHTLVVAGEGSSARLIFEMESEDGPDQALITETTEVFAKANASVEVHAVQDWGPNTYNFSKKRAVAERDSNVTWMNGFFGAKLSKTDVDTLFKGEGCEAENLGIFFGGGDQHMDIASNAYHSARYTNSYMLTKGVLRDRASSVYLGLINIDEDGGQTNSFLSEHTLLLSDDARANAKPNLEIDTNDVSASHGATVGRVDEEQLFYLMSRGIPRDVALSLVVDAFFSAVIQRVDDEYSRDLFQRYIKERSDSIGE